MLRKRVSLFGRSVPLAVIVLLVVATTAFAAWILVLNMNAFVAPAVGAEANWQEDAPTCGELVDPAGDLVVTCWTLGLNHRPNVLGTNARPGASFWLEQQVISAEASLDLCPTLGDIANYTANGIEVSLTAAPIAHGATGTIRSTLTVGPGLIEGPEIDLGVLPIEFIEAAPGMCP